jgi:hypothetical protein
VDKGTCAVRQPCSGGGWLAIYTPSGLDEEKWAVARPFVIAAADALALDDGAGSFRIVRTLASLAAWAIDEGLPLDVEVLLDPATVERFVTVGLCERLSAATYRSVLRRVGPRLTVKAPWEPRPPSVARRQVAVPYDRRELTALRAGALAQPTAFRRRAARALLALGCGAGLDGRWVARVVAEDVASTSWGVMVRVGDPSARVVPVLADWEGEVLDLAASAGEEFLVGGHSTARNRAGALATSLEIPSGCPRYSASRMRSTWMVEHLSMGTRMPELARAAGLTGVTVLSDLLPYVAPLPDADAAAILRGGK